MVSGTFGETWQSKRKIQEENLQDGETNAGSGRKERRQTEVGTREHGSRDMDTDVQDCNNVPSASGSTWSQDRSSQEAFM